MSMDLASLPSVSCKIYRFQYFEDYNEFFTYIPSLPTRWRNVWTIWAEYDWIRGTLYHGYQHLWQSIAPGTLYMYIHYILYQLVNWLIETFNKSIKIATVLQFDGYKILDTYRPHHLTSLQSYPSDCTRLLRFKTINTTPTVGKQQPWRDIATSGRSGQEHSVCQRHGSLSSTIYLV